MTVKELIEKLSSLYSVESIDSDSQVLVRFMTGNANGLCWKDLEDFNEGDVKVNGHTVILDISDK